jgi:hypothetical protein
MARGSTFQTSVVDATIVAVILCVLYMLACRWW